MLLQDEKRQISKFLLFRAQKIIVALDFHHKLLILRLEIVLREIIMVEITIEKLTSLTGDLKDHSSSSEKFRSFISSPDVSRSDLKAWVSECLEKSGQSFHRALQDIVNCIGERLGFDVEYGLYAGRIGAIGYDGKWVSTDANIQLIVETKKTDAYRINPDQVGGYIEELEKKVEKGVSQETYGLFVIGEEEPTTLINTIRGSPYRNAVRVVPVKSFLNLLKMKEEVPLSHSQIVKLLVPIDTINIGEIIETIDDIVETRLREEKIETPTKVKRFEGREEEDIPTVSIEELNVLPAGEVAICPSRPEGITFLLKFNAWGFVRIKRKPDYLAMYVSSPESKISFFGQVKDVMDPADQRSPVKDVYQEYGTYEEGKKIIVLEPDTLYRLKESIPLGSIKGKVPYGLRYVSLSKFLKAKTLDDL